MSERLDEIIALGLKMVMENGYAPSEAVEFLPSPAGEAPEVITEVWEVGLAQLVGGALARTRQSMSEDSPARSGRFQVPTRAKGRMSFYFLTSTFYQGVDGREKPLIEFTVDDVRFFFERARSKAAAWTARREWAATASVALTEQRKDSIQRLSRDSLGVLERMAAEMLGGETS